MEIIKKQRLKAYILLESLVALGLLSLITGLVLGEMAKNRQDLAKYMHQQEVLNVAIMAVQTRQNNLTLNGISVRIERKDGSIHLYEGQTRIVQVEKN